MICLSCIINTTAADYITCQYKDPGPCLNIKTVFPRYGDSHVKDKTAVKPS